MNKHTYENWKKIKTVLEESGKVVLPAEAFDALASRLEQPGHYDPRVARVLSRKAPWE
jgi:uncharacterized protein (DUF1778 family)